MPFLFSGLLCRCFSPAIESAVPHRYDANVRHVLHANGSGVPAESSGSGLVPRNASARVVWMKPFAKRLDNNLPHWMQQSRCKANYEVGPDVMGRQQRV